METAEFKEQSQLHVEDDGSNNSSWKDWLQWFIATIAKVSPVSEDVLYIMIDHYFKESNIDFNQIKKNDPIYARVYSFSNLKSYTALKSFDKWQPFNFLEALLVIRTAILEEQIEKQLVCFLEMKKEVYFFGVYLYEDQFTIEMTSLDIDKDFDLSFMRNPVYRSSGLKNGKVIYRQ